VPLRDAWFQVGMLDAAAFHQLLSGAASYYSCLRTTDIEPDAKESVPHHVHAIRLVNRGLVEVKTATSDGITASIIGFACYYVCFSSLC